MINIWKCPPRRRCDGFNLIETMLTLGVAGVVLAVGIPSYQHLAASNRMTVAINELVAHLHLARSEAVKRALRVVICPSNDGEKCLGAPDWHEGYILFQDRDADRRRDPGEPRLRWRQAASEHIIITSAVSRQRLRYLPDGSAPGSNTTIVFCDRTGSVPPKALIISNTGRPRLAKTRPDGSPLSCP